MYVHANRLPVACRVDLHCPMDAANHWRVQCRRRPIGLKQAQPTVISGGAVLASGSGLLAINCRRGWRAEGGGDSLVVLEMHSGGSTSIGDGITLRLP